MPSVKKAPEQVVSSLKEKILGFLSKVKEKGSPQSKLPSRRNPHFQKALEELVLSGEILSIDERYYHRAFAPSFEKTESVLLSYFEHWMEENRNLPDYKLVSESKLKKELAHVQAYLKDVIEELVGKGKLLKLKAGKTRYYFPLFVFQQDRASRLFDPAQVLKAYKQLVKEKGFIDISLCSLRQRASVERGPFQEWILKQVKEGKAHLSRGDLSVASEEEKAEAVEIMGKKYLLVRLEE